MPRRLLLLGALAAGAIVVVVVVLLSREVEVPRTEDVTLTYRVVYRVEDRVEDEEVIERIEVLEVRRPYDSRVELREGEPPGGDVQTGIVTNRRFHWTLGAAGEPTFGLVRPPAGPERDLSAEAIADAASRGLVESLESGRYAGIECDRYAFRSPYPAPLEPPVAGERTEVCVGADGVMVHESWETGGRIVRVTEAIEVTRGSTVRGARFLMGEEPGESEASVLFGQSFRVTDDEVPLPTPLRPSAEGFVIDRRATLRESGSPQSSPVLIYSEAYLEGEELVVIEQGTSPGGPPWDEVGERVDLEEVGPGLMVFFADHVEVRISGGNNFVRVWARSEERALGFARSLLPAT